MFRTNTRCVRDDWQRLTLIECSETRAACERAVRETLSDLPRPGAPGTFTPEQITRIIALACEAPQKSGRPITHWTHKELADEAAKRGIVESISASRVGCFLREAELQPHKSRYWLNAKEKEKDPQQPVEKLIFASSVRNSQCGGQRSAVSNQLRKMRNSLFFRAES